MTFRIDVHHYFESSAGLEVICAALFQLSEKLDNIMHTLEETLAAVTDEGTKEDSLIALVEGIQKQLADALAGTALPPAVQAKIDAVFQGVTDNATKVQAAIDKNTPPATPPAPAPAPAPAAGTPPGTPPPAGATGPGGTPLTGVKVGGG